MASIGRVTGIDRLVDKLRARAAAVAKDPVVVVGFQTNYAIYVHEDLTARHPVGQAKFLEQPAREMKGEFSRMVSQLAAQGVPLGKILLMLGLRLQREAQLLCPVDTSLLKNSAFTVLEKDVAVPDGQSDRGAPGV